MKQLFTASLAAFALVLPAVAGAQTTTTNSVKSDTSVKDGVATHTTTTEHVSKRKTNQPKKILGVRVGHKTVTHKTVRKTKTSTDGDSSTTVKTD